MTFLKKVVTIQLTQPLSSRPPPGSSPGQTIFPRTKGPGMENGASRDPGTKARAVTPGSRDDKTQRSFDIQYRLLAYRTRVMLNMDPFDVYQADP